MGLYIIQVRARTTTRAEAFKIGTWFQYSLGDGVEGVEDRDPSRILASLGCSSTNGSKQSKGSVI